MSMAILIWSIIAAQILLGMAMGCAAFRILWGPRAQDRVVGLDSLYSNAMLLLLTFGIAPAAPFISRRRSSSHCLASSAQSLWPNSCCVGR